MKPGEPYERPVGVQRTQLIRAALLVNLKEKSTGGALVDRLVDLGIPVVEHQLYPVLRELESEGLVKSVEGPDEPIRGARPRRFYSLTPNGLDVAKGFEFEDFERAEK